MERQARNSEFQLGSATKGQYSDRFVKAVEQVVNTQLAIRSGGLTSLEALSRETPEEHTRVWTYLCTFLHYLPPLQPFDDKNKEKTVRIFTFSSASNEDEATPVGARPDVAIIATMLLDGDQEQLGWERRKGYRFHLEEAHLEKANLEGVLGTFIGPSGEVHQAT